MRPFSFFVCLCILACSDRQRTNPFDSKAFMDHEMASLLGCVAGDGFVDLVWNLDEYDDIQGFNLLRRKQLEDEWKILNEVILLPTTVSYRDEDVKNRETYEYGLVILIENEEEKLFGKTRLATPGPEIVWLADQGSGFIWKISPDGRSGNFARGQFLEINDIAINEIDGSCWFVDGLVGSINRIDVEGRVQSFELDLGKIVDIEIDGEENIGWIADVTRQRVYSFNLQSKDSLELSAVDANFEQLVGLGSSDGACWIVDRFQKRTLLYSSNAKKIVEFGKVEQPIAIAVDGDGDGWVLTEDGNKLTQFKADGSNRFRDFPFTNAIGLSVDINAEYIFLFSKTVLTKFGLNGEVLGEWPELSDTRSIANDPKNKTIWVAMDQEVWKIDESGNILARLSGFSNIGKVVVVSM